MPFPYAYCDHQVLLTFHGDLAKNIFGAGVRALRMGGKARPILARRDAHAAQKYAA